MDRRHIPNEELTFWQWNGRILVATLAAVLLIVLVAVSGSQTPLQSETDATQEW